jgi:hypothetical protein
MADLSVLSGSDASEALKVNVADAVAFLRMLDPRPEARFDLASLDPTKEKGPHARTFFAPELDGPDFAAWVKRENAARNVYVTINAARDNAPKDKRLSKKDIGLVRAAWVDVDKVPKNDAVGNFMASDEPPTVIADSGNGVWGYWVLDNPVTVESLNIEGQLRALVGHFNGDPQAAELARITRLPGTVNFKPGRAPALAKTLTLAGPPADMAALAAWLPPAAAPDTGASRDVDLGVEADLPASVAQAAIWLVKEAPLSVSGEGGNQIGFNVAAKMYNFGLAEPTAIRLMADLWNDRCDPPWGYSELRQLVRNGYAYAQGAFGRDSEAAAETEFGDESENLPEPGAIQTKPTKRAMVLERVRDVASAPFIENEFLIDEWQDVQSLTVMYGESNTGKTHVALDAAMARATRKEWAGYEVRGGGLEVYVAAEGGRGIIGRVKAHALARPEIDWQAAAFELLRYPLNLHGSRRDADALLGLIKAAEDAHGKKCEHFALDTLSRTMPGGNENSPEDMTAYINVVDYLRDRLGAACTIVHHAGKNTAKGARGHSSLRAATDTELEVANMEIVCRKQRDMEGGKTLRFGYRPFILGRDRKGKDRTTVIADVRQVTEFDRRLLTPQQEKVLEAIRARVEAETQKTQSKTGGVMPEKLPAFARKDLAHLGLPPTSLTEVLGVLTEQGFISNPKRGLYIPTRMTE